MKKWWVFLVGVEPYALQIGTYPMCREDIIDLLSRTTLRHDAVWAFSEPLP